MRTPCLGTVQRIRTTLSREDGVALLMVLFVVVAMTALVVSLIDTTQRHLHLTQFYKNRLQAFWTAQSGIQAGVAILQMDTQLQPGYDAFDSAWNCESTTYQETALMFLSVPLCGSSLIDPAQQLAAETPLAEEQPSPVRCPIIDENRKLSLFPLVGQLNGENEASEEETFGRLVYLLQFLLSERDTVRADLADGSEDLLVDAGAAQTPISYGRAQELAGYIVDWIDSPNNTSTTELNPDQAEESCPDDDLPYMAKNGMMDSVDEVALVCGFRHMARGVIEKIARNLTVYNLMTNINTATRPVLYAFCSQITNTPAETESLEIYRALHPYEDTLPDAAIQQDTKDAYETVLLPLVSDEELIQGLQAKTAVLSDFFRLGLGGVVINTGTGAVDASARVTMIVRRGGGQPATGAEGAQAAPATQQGGLSLYYREG